MAQLFSQCFYFRFATSNSQIRKLGPLDISRGEVSHSLPYSYTSSSSSGSAIGALSSRCTIIFLNCHIGFLPRNRFRKAKPVYGPVLLLPVTPTCIAALASLRNLLFILRNVWPLGIHNRHCILLPLCNPPLPLSWVTHLQAGAFRLSHHLSAVGVLILTITDVSSAGRDSEDNEDRLLSQYQSVEGEPFQASKREGSNITHHEEDDPSPPILLRAISMHDRTLHSPLFRKTQDAYRDHRRPLSPSGECKATRRTISHRCSPRPFKAARTKTHDIRK